MSSTTTSLRQADDETRSRELTAFAASLLREVAAELGIRVRDHDQHRHRLPRDSRSAT